MSRRWRRQVATLVCYGAWVALLHLTPMQAQELTGEIRVSVADPSGGAMIVSGKLQNIANGAVRTFRTDSRGAYMLDHVPFGRYRLTLSKTGFSTKSMLLDVQSDAPLSRTVVMEL